MLGALGETGFDGAADGGGDIVIDSHEESIACPRLFLYNIEHYEPSSRQRKRGTGSRGSSGPRKEKRRHFADSTGAVGNALLAEIDRAGANAR